MKPIQAALSALLFMSVAAPVGAATLPSDKEKLRAQAEHDCYDDVQKLCSDDTSDEAKVRSCMKAHHAQLSPKCAADFDKGGAM